MSKIPLLIIWLVAIPWLVHSRNRPSVRLPDASPNPPSACAPAAFLTFESGRLAGVDWVEHRGNQVHTRVVLTQSEVIDASIDLRPDQTARHSSVVLSIAGGEPEKPKTRDLAEGAIYWSDMITSSVEQAIARARMLGQPLVKIPTANLYHDSPNEAEVERIDANDWVLRINGKRYEVLTDDQGCMLAATLPDYGVTIERRIDFQADQYPLWAPYGAPPDGAYTAAEVNLPAPQGHSLAGTLTLPRGHGAVPAAVLITGLSPHERNNGQPPWMPFRDIADALTRAGIAVLRVDDRGVGKSTGDHAPSTSFDEADDVQTEVAWLRKRPGIDARKIVLVGYSEGGYIAPMVAAKDPSIAAIITLDGPGVPMSEVAHYQVEQAVLHDAKIPSSDRQAETEKRLREALKDLTPRESVAMTINPIEYDRGVRCPALIIHGGTDRDVPVRSAQRIATAIRSNGNSDVTVRIFRGISHSLLPDAVGVGSGWPTLPGFLTAPDLLDLISKWTADKLGTRRGD
ncbi:MAG: alpha/beta fold hydrolase [Acidobacteria bacterium]|nr:alpha/beta fold hydrolase [Acidobacteriota bacterium]